MKFGTNLRPEAAKEIVRKTMELPRVPFIARSTQEKQPYEIILFS
jgi:hypothetical protein